MPAQKRQRDLGIVVFGATGFVGRLVAEYLARHAPDTIRIGLAGRSAATLGEVRAGLGAATADWPLLLADSDDPDSLRKLAARTTVLVTTVGPYRRSGLRLVEACVEAGTHYADLTGEVLFIRDSIDRFHEAAAHRRVRIVHSCGFDSIPSDLAALLLHEAVKADSQGEVAAATLLVRTFRGGASGGTLASLKVQLDEVRRSAAARRLAADPYALSPDRSEEPDLGDETDQWRPGYDRDLGTWVAPFVMGPINTRVVRRSNALQGWSYGRRFRYRELLDCGPGPAGAIKANTVVAGLVALAGGLSLRPTRWILDRLLPQPGTGPSAATREAGSFAVELHARTSTGARYVATVAARGDPGYAATSVMLGESALCLALDELPARFGVLTPATAMGDALATRLRNAGQTLTVRRAANSL